MGRLTTLTLDFLANTQHKRVRRLVSLLPPTRGYGFEQRIGDAGFLHFFAVYGDAGLLKRLADNAPWPDVRRCAREVKDQLWLEFDCGVDEPVPLLFAPVPRDFEGVMDVAAVLNGEPLPPSLRKQVAKVVGCLPAGAYPFQIAVANGAVRAYMNFLSAPHMQGYVEKIGLWGAGFSKALAIASPVADTLALSLDVARDGVGKRIGVEFSPGQPLPAASAGAWSEVFDVLRGHGFDDGRREFWLSWPGSSGDNLRVLSHCKLVCVEEEIVDVKVYFGAVRARGACGLC